MKKEMKTRDKKVNIRLNDTEHEEMMKLFRKSTCQYLADFVRMVILKKPVVFKERNQSMDDFLADMVELRKDLDDIAGDFRRSVKRLNELEKAADIQHWILLNEQDKTRLFRQIEAINIHVNTIYQQCLQK